MLRVWDLARALGVHERGGEAAAERDVARLALIHEAAGADEPFERRLALVHDAASFDRGGEAAVGVGKGMPLVPPMARAVEIRLSCGRL